MKIEEENKQNEKTFDYVRMISVYKIETVFLFFLLFEHSTFCLSIYILHEIYNSLSLSRFVSRSFVPKQTKTN